MTQKIVHVCVCVNYHAHGTDGNQSLRSQIWSARYQEKREETQLKSILGGKEGKKYFFFYINLSDFGHF